METETVETNAIRFRPDTSKFFLYIMDFCWVHLRDLMALLSISRANNAPHQSLFYHG